jgi:predicted TPR repeat methyltransferase
MSNNITAAIQAALAKHQSGDLHTAEQMYRNILSNTPKDAGIVNLLGVALFQQNKLQEADEKIRKAIKLNPSEPTFHFNLGNTAKALGQWDQAEDSYRRALKLKPHYSEATQNLCNLLEAEERYEDALHLYRESIRFNPNNLNAHIKLAGLSAKLGNWSQVAASCQQILASQPNNLEARLLYAQALHRNDQSSLAITQYQVILQNYPQHEHAHFQLSRLLGARGEIEEALHHAKTATELAPQFGDAQLNYAGLLLVAEQHEASAAAYRRVLEINPADVSAAHMLSAIENRNTQRAEPDYVRGLFDSYADRFEQHLQQDMSYDIPRKMHALLTQLDPLMRYETLDLGCGTGLSGLAVHELATRMVGVDLSPKMLAQARDKNIYAELHAEDVVGYLDRTPDGVFDLVLSADLFVYLGDLSDVFAKINRVLRADGLFVFSTEQTSENTYQGYKLETTGRYTHHTVYLHALIEQFGYRIEHFAQETIRMNLGKPALGHLVVLRKSGSASTVSRSHSDQGSRLEQAVHEILSDHYANHASIRGWLFTILIDHHFIDSGISRNPIQRRTTNLQTRPESTDIDQAATEHLARIVQLGDSTAQYSALEELTLLNTPSLTRDNFPGLTELQCQQAVCQFFSKGRLNLVIIGAGPVGLVLASALKLALQSEVNVLVVENRVSSPHHKLPYERRWITNIPKALLKGLVEKSLSDIFTRIGDGNYIGCTINVLESLLLLSCRRLGVKFLFAESCDLSFIRDSPVQLVFDASGNRFRPPSWPDSPEKIDVRHNIQTDILGSNDAKISPYGIKIHPSTDNRHITLGAYDKLLFPLHKNKPVKLAMLKLIHIPARLYGMLLKHIRQHNHDNKYYVWPGTLQAAINQVIVIVNLEKSEYDYLCSHHAFPMRLTEAMEIEAFSKSLDERTSAILGLLAEHADESDQIGIDAPFLYEPYMVNTAIPEQLFDRPLICVGDSIYNGNVKHGNGLGPHLQYLRHVQSVFQKYAR